MVYVPSGYLAYSVNSITMNNLTYRTSGDSYVGFQGLVGEYYHNVRIENLMWTYSKTALFDNCTFYQGIYEYCLWCYATDNLLINDCTFDCMGKAVLIYNEGLHNTSAEIKKTNFVDNETPGAHDKAAIEIHTETNPKYTVSVDECVAEGFSSAGSCGNNLWNACINRTVHKSATSLVIVDKITELVPTGDKATVVSENGTSCFESAEAAFAAAQTGDTVILLEDVELQDFGDKYLTICGSITESESSNDYVMTKLTVGEKIPGSAYMRLKIDSGEESVEAVGVVSFTDCVTDIEIAPGDGSAIIDDAVFDESGYVISGTVEFTGPEGKAKAEESLVEGCVILEKGGINKVFCTIKLDLGDGEEDVIYLEYGKEIPDLEKLPEKSGFTFAGLYLGEKEYFDADGRALVEISDLLPNTVLEAKWTEGVEQPVDWTMIFVAVLVVAVVGGAIILAFRS